MPEPTLFSSIISGAIPAHKVYEDERTFAFLDIYPQLPGHTLVVPKAAVAFVWDLNEADYQALMAAARRIALRLRAVTGAKYVAERVIGVDVPHAHVHLIPFDDVAALGLPPTRDVPAGDAELAKLAKAVAF